MKWFQFLKNNHRRTFLGIGRGVVLFGAIAVGIVWTSKTDRDAPTEFGPQSSFIRTETPGEKTTASDATATPDFGSAGEHGSAATLGSTPTNVNPPAPQAPLPLPVKSPRIGREALESNVALLEIGKTHLERSAGYTARFIKQEVISGRLNPPVEMQVKVRHKPFSVYMNWKTSDPGKEIIYVDGRNENRVVAHFGGWKGRVLPTLRVDPEGSLAMSYSRYPITEFGLLALHQTLLSDRQVDSDRGLEGVTCLIEPGSDETGRPVYYFEIEYDSPEISPLYRRSEQIFDRETSVLLRIDNFTWPRQPIEDSAKLREETLLESYHYRDLAFTSQLADVDFDETNSDYQFKQ